MSSRPPLELWFAPRRLGYGAGWPIRWQGWGLLLVTVAGLIAAQRVPLPGNVTLTVGLVLLFGAVARRRTQGGWHWRGLR